MSRLERWIAERDAWPTVTVTIDGRPCPTQAVVAVPADDWDALLAVARAAVEMVAPAGIPYSAGWHESMMLRHRKLADALAALEKGGVER